MRVIGVLAVAGCLGCGTVSSPDDADGGTADGAPGEDGATSDGAPADAMIVPVTCEETPVCGEAGEVGSIEDIVAIAGACATWGAAEIDVFRPRTPSFLVSQAISICPDDIPLPPDCSQGQPLCNAGVRISVEEGLTGIDPTVACNGAQFAAGARFRVRFNVEPANLGSQFRSAHIQFERPCDAACASDERRCEANDSCYAADDACFACGFGTREQCACRTPDNGVLPDCTECEVFYDDFAFLGGCLEGVCERDPCATCPCD